MSALVRELDEIAAEHGFSGVVRLDLPGEVVERAYGLADRGRGIPNTVETQFAVASATKGLTALVALSLIEEGRLALETTARSLLGDDLPLIAADVTVEHLLAHRSGIGDYVDEETDIDLDDYLMPVSVHELGTSESYLRVLDGHPAKFAAGERFAYSNSGYAVLAILVERASGEGFPDLVSRRVCAPAGMTDTAFLRSDELPERAALGYLEVDGRWRTNVFHLPVRGTGDGGAYTTVADVSALWRALFAGRIVSPATVAEMTRPRSDAPGGSLRYGLGLWLAASADQVMLEGCDTGVSFRSTHDPATGLTRTVIGNTADGAWPVARFVAERLG